MAINGSSSSLLGRLRTVVKKVRFLMNFNINRWRLASMIGGASSSKRRLSFNDWPPGLTIVTEDEDHDHEPGDSGRFSGGLQRTISGFSGGLQRTISFPNSEEDDIDKRAEMFISNFYKQLRMERQVSLELRYCRDNSFGSNSISISP